MTTDTTKIAKLDAILEHLRKIKTETFFGIFVWKHKGILIRIPNVLRLNSKIIKLICYVNSFNI